MNVRVQGIASEKILANQFAVDFSVLPAMQMNHVAFLYGEAFT